MKKVLSLLSLTALLFLSCEGDPGPPGPIGPEGPPGDALLGSVFEYQVDFNAANNYAAIFEFPSEIEVFESDVVLAYILNDVDNGVDIWEPLPQTLFFDNDGILLYGFDHTFADIQFFMDGNIDLSTLDPIFTDGVVFRVAIIPADLLQGVDTSDINNILNLAQDIKTIQVD
ncbi:hypothetical protein [Robertkochia aurantiaca]|uniref:hypothetical protein n=1 Tax=Robertkochia aurantiaca TaxID=2873700 RepID=UPI001CCF534A|nr:hypothetical protein [Robertkochia sp. 3YJGBD-33]